VFPPSFPLSLRNRIARSRAIGCADRSAAEIGCQFPAFFSNRRLAPRRNLREKRSHCTARRPSHPVNPCDTA